MNVISRIVSIVISLGLLFLIFDLVRRRKLTEKYALLWLITAIVIFILALFQNLLNWVTHTLGIFVPINTLFFSGIFFLILINIHFSLIISKLTEQNRKIVQKIALLELEINNIIRLGYPQENRLRR